MAAQDAGGSTKKGATCRGIASEVDLFVNDAPCYRAPMARRNACLWRRRKLRCKNTIFFFAERAETHAGENSMSPRQVEFC